MGYRKSPNCLVILVKDCQLTFTSSPFPQFSLFPWCPDYQSLTCAQNLCNRGSSGFRCLRNQLVLSGLARIRLSGGWCRKGHRNKLGWLNVDRHPLHQLWKHPDQTAKQVWLVSPGKKICFQLLLRKSLLLWLLLGAAESVRIQVTVPRGRMMQFLQTPTPFRCQREAWGHKNGGHRLLDQPRTCDRCCLEAMGFQFVWDCKLLRAGKKEEQTAFSNWESSR